MLSASPGDAPDTPDGGYDDTEDAPLFEPTRIPNPLHLLKKGAVVLSQTETSALRPLLIDAIRGYSDEMDKLIERTNRAHAPLSEPIWSSLDDAEIATLVDSLLIIGQRQKHVALAIREVARAWKMVEVGLILVPRFLQTMQFYAQNGGIALW